MTISTIQLSINYLKNICVRAISKFTNYIETRDTVRARDLNSVQMFLED